MTLQIITCVICGYLLGNLNGAIIVSGWLHKEDIRQKGSGNAGLTNFYRNYGGFDTLLVLVIDAGKTVLACFAGRWIFLPWCPEFCVTASMLAGSMSVIGHIFPCTFGMRGGKGILCCAALAAFMDWRIFCICIGIFILAVAITRYVSLGSILGCIAFPFLFWWRFSGQLAVILIAAGLALLAIIMHRGNIGRLLHGTESKLSFDHKKTNKPTDGGNE